MTNVCGGLTPCKKRLMLTLFLILVSFGYCLCWPFAGTMLNWAKEKVKRALSGRSRSSRSSSSSRDNMSVDSSHRSHACREEEEIPTVPRSHFRIRIQMMVEQIVVKNNYKRQALELLKRQTFGHGKRFETCFLIKTGLKQDMNNALTTVGWENFADIVEPGSHFSFLLP